MRRAVLSKARTNGCRGIQANPWQAKENIAPIYLARRPGDCRFSRAMTMRTILAEQDLMPRQDRRIAASKE